MRPNQKAKTKGEQGKKVRISVTVKWSVITSLFIFMVFAVFSFVAYQTCTRVIFAGEKRNLETTMTEVVERLSRTDYSLTISSANTNLRQAINYGEGSEGYSDNQTIESGMLQLNAFISSLSQNELYTYVYNVNGKLVFQTRAKDIPFSKVKERTILTKAVDGVKGFQMTQPVFSKSNGDLVGYVMLYYKLEDYDGIRHRLLVAMIVLVIVAMLISSVCGYFLAAMYMRPLKIMSKTIAKIRTEPNAVTRMPTLHTNDEFSDLTEAFNEMMERIEKYMASQQSFVEDVSHELRTPVAIIEGHLNLLSRWGKDDPEVLEESIQASLQEIARMKTLVQEMLDLSRVEQVDPTNKSASTKGNTIVRQTVTNFRLLYPEFEFILRDFTGSEKWIQMQQNHLEQVLIIILDNAVKYSVEIKKVVVQVKANVDFFQVEIQDFGEGIPENEREKVFNRFYRVDKARSREKGGNGLGLSIAKQLVDNAGGDIFIESQDGEGTIFIIQLPIAPEKSM